MKEPLVRLDQVDVFYGQVQALFGVSLHVDEGETVAVLGGNASGKSTTVKTVLGLVRPRRGAVYYRGQRIDQLSPFKRVELGLGSIPEGRRVFPEMTVRDNLLMGAYVRRREGPSALEAEMERILALFPVLANRLNQMAGTMSGGEQQMLAMGRALMGRPDMLCIDEPSMGLSPLYVDRVYDVIRKLKETGVTILMVEQSANRALEVADRAYVLQNGQVVLAGEARELATNRVVQEAYLGGAAVG